MSYPFIPSLRARGAFRCLGPLVLALALVGPWLLFAPAAPRPEPLPDVEQLRRACLEAHDNCLMGALAARGLVDPAQDVLFSTLELRRALRSELLQGLAYGELAAIEREARWLATLDPNSPPGARSWEDVRFLLGGIHWYLEGALRSCGQREAPPHGVPPTGYDPTALRRYRGMTFDDLLGQWD